MKMLGDDLNPSIKSLEESKKEGDDEDDVAIVLSRQPSYRKYPQKPEPEEDIILDRQPSYRKIVTGAS